MKYQTPIGPHDGDSWENLCHVCLKIRHKGEYLEIPASPGDYGLDGILLNGEIYQCYCPERQCTDKELYESQRKKVHEDLMKLKRNEESINKILNGRKVKRWHLLTPKIPTNELIAYCSKKKEEIRQQNLSFIDDDFIIVPQDYKFLYPELGNAHNVLDYTSNLSGVQSRIELNAPKISETEINNYKEDIQNNTYTANASRKYQAIFPQDGKDYSQKILKSVDMTVENLLIGDTMLKEWETLYQDQLERFYKIINTLEREIDLLCQRPAKSNGDRYDEINDKVKNTIDTEFNSFSEQTRRNLSLRVMADWLLRCPLNFE